MKRTHLDQQLAQALAFCAMLTVSFTLGCGGNASTPATPASADPGTSAATSAASPETVAVVQNGIGTEPAQCVAIFLDSLRSGDEAAANGVLTTKAREELAKTAYEMQPLGTPQGQFQIGRVGYPFPEDRSVALVECAWSEPPVDGQEPLTMDIVCEVHQEPEGWRISGLGVTVPGSEETLVLDFEDAAALQSTIDAATGQPTSGGNDSIAGTATSGVPAQTVSGTPSAIKPETSSSAAPAYPPLPGYPSSGGN